MTKDKQPEALRLAAWLNEGAWHQMRLGDVEAAGRELRRLHAENEALRKDAERMDWLLWKLPGDALRNVVGDLSDTSSGAEFRAAIDAAMQATK